MANVNSISSNSYSSTSSLYGNRNVLSGLASGMDTEAMIQNSVSGYQTKVTQLQQDVTKLEWKQDAYRSITDKMIALAEKYTSYSSKTNLTSGGFFSKAVTTSASGTNASKVSAAGKASSDIQISAVKSLATSAKYTVDAGALTLGGTGSAGTAIDWEKTREVSNISGSLSITSGSKKVTINFGEDGDDVVKNADDLVKKINEKLEKENSSIKAELSDGKITFTDGGNGVYISGASGDFKEKLGINPASSTDDDRLMHNSFEVPSEAALTKEQGMSEYLSGKSVSVTLNGATKSISLGEVTDMDSLVANLQKGLNSAFGEGRVTLSSEGGALKFGVPEGSGSTLMVTSSVGEALGLGTSGVSNYLNTNKSLGELLGADYFAGSEDGKEEFVLNGVSVGKFNKDTKLSDVLSAINENASAGVKVSFSSLTNQLSFSTTATGKDQKIDFGDGLASRLFKTEDSSAVTSVGGTDAEITATVNGKEISMQRSSNSFSMDGLNVTLKGTFETKEGEEAVSFSTKSDADTIVNTLKSFADEYNAIMKEIHDAYSTQPVKQSSGKAYSPLTDDDKSSMSESAVKSYEEKAKTGLLFADRDLSTLYNKMRDIFSTGSANLAPIGFSTTYSDGVTQIKIDEDKLRSALESDPEKVKNVFTQSKATGAASDGIMARVKDVFNQYASKSIATPGILVKKAGTKLSSVSLLQNTLQTQIEGVNKQIESWQSKLSSKIDYYTKQFSMLEQMMSSMNNQSSALAGLMGY